MGTKERIIRTFIGFVLSFLLHLLLFWLLFVSVKKWETPPPAVSKKVQKMTLNLSQFQPPAPKPKPKPKPQPPKPQPKPEEKPVVKEKKKIVQTSAVSAKKKVVQKKKRPEVVQKAPDENNATKVVRKKTEKKKRQKVAKAKPHHSKKKKKKIVKKKPLPKHFRLPKKHTRDKLANALLGGKSSKVKPQRNRAPSHAADRMIRQLYGKEFYHFTKTQQKFIRDNLSEIYRITQNTLYMNGYPEVAVRTQQQGVNIVSFYLHPNGDISQLRLVKPMGYEALDQNTIAVIQIAYKDYPRPKTKTKIVFYVNYRLY
jgi:TonB family protein